MKCYRIFLAISILILTSLACQAVAGTRNSNGNEAPTAEPGGNQPQPVQPTAENNNPSSGSGSTVSTDFPITADAYNVTDLGNGSILYYTKLSAEDAMKFYRDEYTSRGYKERQTLTIVTGTTFSMIFDGDSSGKSVVVQSVDLGDGSRTITVRLE